MKSSSSVVAKISRIGRGSRSFRSAGNLLSRHIWVRPLIAALVLSAVAWWVNRAVEGAVREHVAAGLKAIRDADVTALRIWMKEQEANAQVLAMADRVR